MQSSNIHLWLDIMTRTWPFLVSDKIKGSRNKKIPFDEANKLNANISDFSNDQSNHESVALQMTPMHDETIQAGGLYFIAMGNIA